MNSVIAATAPTEIRHEVAIVIVNYNSAALIHRCIASLREHLRINPLFILVDNSEQSEIRQLPKPASDLLLIRAEQNNGFAAGCNLGLAEVQLRKIPFVLLLNPDTRAESDFLTPLLEVARIDTRIAALAPTIVYDDKEKAIHFAGGRVRWCRGGPKHFDQPRPPPTDGWYDDSFLTGAALLLRTAVTEEVGAMPEDYFLYFEDADYIQRIRSIGYKTVYVPAARICHAVSSTTGMQSPLFVYYFSRNRIIFLLRWSPPVCFWYYLAYTTLVKLPGAIIIFGIIRGRWQLTRRFFQGYIDGIQYALSSTHSPSGAPRVKHHT
jgi:GT2 family glycosyltransferase